MAQTINTNVSSLNAQRNLNMSQSSLATSLQRLSTGLRINSAKDDAAGLAISERFTSQIRGLTQAARNANDGISLAQTAEGALSQVGDNLQRMRELSVQSANATNSASDRAALQQEVSQLAAEIDRVATQTQFNGLNLLDGSFTNQQFQVGANSNQTISIASIANARTSALGQGYGVTTGNSSLTSAGAGVTAAGQFSINGTDVFTASGGAAITSDAKAMASAINASNISGVTATANANTGTGTFTTATTTAAGTAVLTLNGININLNLGLGATTATDVANTISAIQSNSAATGVTAVASGTGIKLTAADGRNIAASFAAGTATGATAASVGLGTVGAQTTVGSYTIDYKGTAGLTIAGSGAAADKGFANAVTNSAATGTAISAVDISTVGGANAALTSIDNALSAINSNRAALGAFQNRFASTITNLQTTSENLSASRSRIQDTDFAAETANLTRSQILQQAGTAMLAQANSLPQNVLSLLK